jgi:hypothetical protein
VQEYLDPTQGDPFEILTDSADARRNFRRIGPERSPPPARFKCNGHPVPYHAAMWILAAAGLLFLAGLGLIGLNLFVLAGALPLSFAGLLPLVAAVALLLGAASL